MKKLLTPMFPEFDEINQMKEDWILHGKVEVIANVSHDELNFPIHSFSIGSDEENVPTLVFTGGIHGLERIGTWVG